MSPPERGAGQRDQVVQTRARRPAAVDYQRAERVARRLRGPAEEAARRTALQLPTRQHHKRRPLHRDFRRRKDRSSRSHSHLWLVCIYASVLFVCLIYCSCFSLVLRVLNSRVKYVLTTL